MASSVTCPVGSGVLCRTQNRTSQTVDVPTRSVVSPMNTWLQKPSVPSVRIDVVPLCAWVLSTATVPVPEQFGVVTVHRPVGVPPVWFSKSSQKIVPAQLVPPPLVVVVVVVVVGVVLPPLQAIPLSAKFVGVAFVPEYVAWKPKLTV